MAWPPFEKTTSPLSSADDSRRSRRRTDRPIQPQLGYQGFEEADLIIEAVFESMALKKQVFAEIDRIAKPDCVLASNTSTLDIDQIAEATRGRRWLIGLHFFSPANVMRLVEIVRGSRQTRKWWRRRCRSRKDSAKWAWWLETAAVSWVIG